MEFGFAAATEFALAQPAASASLPMSLRVQFIALEDYVASGDFRQRVAGNKGLVSEQKIVHNEV